MWPSPQGGLVVRLRGHPSRVRGRRLRVLAAVGARRRACLGRHGCSPRLRGGPKARGPLRVAFVCFCEAPQPTDARRRACPAFRFLPAVRRPSQLIRPLFPEALAAAHGSRDAPRTAAAAARKAGPLRLAQRAPQPAAARRGQRWRVWHCQVRRVWSAQARVFDGSCRAFKAPKDTAARIRDHGSPAARLAAGLSGPVFASKFPHRPSHGPRDFSGKQ